MIITKDNIIEVLNSDKTPLNISYVFRSEKDNGWITNRQVKIKLIQDGEIITIPKGFYWDLSSTPKILWPFLAPYGDFLIGALVHDYLYRTQHHLGVFGVREARKFADKEMALWSDIANGGRRIDNKLRYLGCRAFGAKAYKNK